MEKITTKKRAESFPLENRTKVNGTETPETEGATEKIVGTKF